MALKPRPPSVRDYGPRFLGNPFELAMSILVLVSMVATAKLLLSPEYDRLPPIGLAALPEWLMWLWVIAGTASGLLILVGLTWGNLKAKARAVEAAGLVLAAAVWTSVFVADVITEPSAWQGWAQYAVLAFGSMLRLYAMGKYERAVTRALERTESISGDERDSGADGAL